MSACLLLALLAVGGCNLPGKPTPADIVPRPTDVLDPVVLYKQNCAGCHGADGKRARRRRSAIRSISRSSTTTRCATRSPRAGRHAHGGFRGERRRHADRQAGRRHHSGHAAALGTAADLARRHRSALRGEDRGNPQQGAAAFGTFCASCHGADGKGLGQGRFHRESQLSQPDHRSGIANRRHHRPAGLQRAGLAQQRSWPSHERPADHRRGGVAGGASGRRAQRPLRRQLPILLRPEGSSERQ